MLRPLSLPSVYTESLSSARVPTFPFPVSKFSESSVHSKLAQEFGPVFTQPLENIYPGPYVEKVETEQKVTEAIQEVDSDQKRDKRRQGATSPSITSFSFFLKHSCSKKNLWQS